MQRKTLPSAATITDPSMGITFEEDEDKISTNNQETTNAQQITIHVENDALESSKHRQISNNSIPEMHVIETRQCASKPVTPTSVNGDMVNMGNVIVNKFAIYENFVDDEDESGSDKSNYLSINSINDLQINKKAKFKSLSVNSIATTHRNPMTHLNNSTNNNSKNNDINHINNNNTFSSQYIINEKANCRRFLPNFNFSGNKNSYSCSGKINLGLNNEPKIICKIIDRN
jgi:hypothetical protein